MLRVEKLKKFKNNFPILVGNKAISNHFCTSLIKEISSSETFDDHDCAESLYDFQCVQFLGARAAVC